MPARWARRSTSEARKLGPPGRPTSTARSGVPAGAAAHLHPQHLPPLGDPLLAAVQPPGVAQRQPGQHQTATLRRAGRAVQHPAGQPRGVAGLHQQRPAGPEHPRRVLGEQLQPPVRRAGEQVHQLGVAVQVGAAEVGAQRLDDDAGDALRGGDEGVGEAAHPQRDDEVVHGTLGPALDHVEAEDVAPGQADRAGDRAERAGTVRQHQTQQVGHRGSSHRPGTAAREPLEHPCARSRRRLRRVTAV